MLPPAIAPAALVPPPPFPTAALIVKVAPAAGKGFSHLPGATAHSSRVNYADRNANLWYGLGGWQTRNGHWGGQVGRLQRGVEDADERRA